MTFDIISDFAPDVDTINKFNIAAKTISGEMQEWILGKKYNMNRYNSKKMNKRQKKKKLYEKSS